MERTVRLNTFRSIRRAQTILWLEAWFVILAGSVGAGSALSAILRDPSGRFSVFGFTASGAIPAILSGVVSLLTPAVGIALLGATIAIGHRSGTARLVATIYCLVAALALFDLLPFLLAPSLLSGLWILAGVGAIAVLYSLWISPDGRHAFGHEKPAPTIDIHIARPAARPRLVRPATRRYVRG